MTRLSFYNGRGRLHRLDGVSVDLLSMPAVPGLPQHVTEIDYWPHRGELRISAERAREMTLAECDAVRAFIDTVANAARAAIERNMTPQDFVATIAPAAVASMHTTGVPASFTIAEAALESGWGGSQLAQQGCNLFGVKADRGWGGDTLTMRTREYLQGQWVIVPALWRRYSDWQGCMDDHGAFLRENPRYAACFATTDGEEFARRVAAAGYATDPSYAPKLIAIMRAHNLRQFDEIAPATLTA